MIQSVSKILFFVFMIVMINGCDSYTLFGKDDPFANQSDAVKKGETPNKPQPEKPKPLGQDVLIVDSSDFYAFREGEEQEITIASRNFLEEESTYEIGISNINDFKDAVVTMTPGNTKTQQLATIKFKWTPPVGFVIQDKMVYPLDIEVYTTNNTEKYVRTKSIPLHIYNEKFSVPEIVSISNVPDSIKEKDTSRFFEVQVKDIDAKDADGLRPSLQFLSKNIGNLNLAPFLKVQKVTLKDESLGLWDFRVEINLKGLELTTDQTAGYFDIYAISANGIESSPKGQQIAVKTSISAPITSWMSDIEFKIGTENRFNFTVLDPKGEGAITSDFVTQCSTLVGAPQCSCQSVAGTSGKFATSSLCSIVWNIPAGETPRSEKFSISSTNKSPVDPETKPATFDKTINLVQ